MKHICKFAILIMVVISATSCISRDNEKKSLYNYKPYNGVSFKGGGDIRNSCNIGRHDCAFGIDSNSDGYCDNCLENGYKCHIGKHQAR